MTRRSVPLLLAGVWVVALLMRLHAAGSAQALAQKPPLIDFASQIQPIIQANCLECHSQDKRKGGLSLATYADLLDGGKDGAVVRPGNGAGSLIFHRLSGQIEPQMPLDEIPLSEAEIAIIRLWIDQGARPNPAAPSAPPPWEAPLALTRPALPQQIWPDWSRPLDRLVAAYLSATPGRRDRLRQGSGESAVASAKTEAAASPKGVAPQAREARGGGAPRASRNADVVSRISERPEFVSDAQFARRAYLDIWGLLPSPAELQAFAGDRAPDKRDRLVQTLLADNQKYAEHWMTFWNDLLRNEDGVTYFSENASRKSITTWLLWSLQANLPYDQFVAKLVNPAAAGDPDGFLTGVNWRGETSAAVTPWMQASQNTAQVFLGVNMKCNACHDSFVSKWKLKDAYALAAFFSPEPRLQLFRCDVARDEFAEPGFLYPELHRSPASSSLADRRAAAAAIFTDARNGRMPRTVVNRLWDRLLGRGIVRNSDEMDGKPWSPEVLDWLASDFVEHRYDLKHLIATIVTSRAYQMPAVARTGEPPPRDYVFAGPEVRRLTAEQFGDAIGLITGEWSVNPGPPRPSTGPRAKTASDAVSTGVYGREWRAASTRLSRSLGRPIRDQVISVRASQSTTLQALELVNGDLLIRWLMRGAKRMIGELQPDPLSLFNAPVAGRNPSARSFDIDVTAASRLWLIVTDTGSNAPERVLPAWTQAELVTADGAATPLSALKPVEASGTRPDPMNGTAGRIAIKAPSTLVYDISGKGFTRLRGTVDIDNSRTEVGSTLNPAVRFFVFDTAPNMERLVPPAPEPPLPTLPAVATPAQAVDRVFWHALGRAPSAAERKVAESAIADPSRPGRVSGDALADLLWAVMMKPEFQLIY